MVEIRSCDCCSDGGVAIVGGITRLDVSRAEVER